MHKLTLTLRQLPIDLSFEAALWIVTVPDDVTLVMIGRGDDTMNQVQDNVQHCYVPGSSVADHHVSFELKNGRWVAISLVSGLTTNLTCDGVSLSLQEHVGTPCEIENGCQLYVGDAGLIEIALT